eukprot:m.96127 g.96127  ORF g.96127 m.96127 type:complete len:381 (+) comp13530_c0_seq5:34-1176(+)
MAAQWCLFLVAVAALCTPSHTKQIPTPADLYPESTLRADTALRSAGVIFSPDDTLRELGKARGIFIGAAANHGFLLNTSDPLYQSTLRQQYSLYTAENSCKFSPTEPKLNNYSFGDCYYIKHVCDTNNCTFRGHNLCWGVYNPSWLDNGKFSPSQLVSVLQNHITNVMTHYKGLDLIGWDVVNEAVSDHGPGTFKNVTPWYPAVPNYVDLAFQAARAVDPNVKLFYNDYGAEGMSPKSDKVYNMVKSMKSRNIPIDGVGLQFHISIDNHPSFEDIETNMKRLGALGLDVHITELDVRCTNPCTSDKLNIQAQIYGGLLEVCLRVPACKNFETWGFTDKHTWIWSFQNPNHYNLMPLPFDINYGKKPAYFEMIQVLKNSTN